MPASNSLPLRVAVVQMHAHLAFEDEGKLYLGEPLGKPLDRPLLSRLDDRLPPDSLPQGLLRQLRRHIARAYDIGLLARLKAILTFCADHQTDLVVFPEYSIPGSLVPALRDEANRLGLAIVAGTHLVTTELLDHAPYAAAFDTPPAPGQAIAPFIFPGDEEKVRFQPKLFPSQWETSLFPGEGPIVFDWKAKNLSIGVAICIDFLRHRDPEGSTAHETWRKTDLLVVPSATPKDTPQQFENSGDHYFRSTLTPVIYANLAQDGGTGVFGDGKPNGRLLAAGSAITPLSRGHEGITIVHLDLRSTANTTPRRYDADTPIRLIAYALILHRESHPALASVADKLVAASDPSTFKQLCREHKHTLATAARERRDIPVVHARWDSLARSADGLHNLTDLRLRATDLWLPDDVPAISQIERALAQGTIQALRGIDAETTTPEDRASLQDTIDDLDEALRDSLPQAPDPTPPSVRAILDEVLRFRAPNTPSLSRVPINSDGTLDPWVPDPGPPPQHLTAQGFQLRDRASFGEAGPGVDLEPAATWLALQDSPPSWLGTSPSGTPALVIAPGHVVLVSHVIPPEADIRLARPTASKPLPIALLTGSTDGLTVRLPPGVLPLDRAIRDLARDRDHLRALVDYEYTPERATFVEPKLVFSGSRDPKPALPILTEWLRANTPSAVLSGPIGGGRTTLLRTWLVDVARDALLRDGLPVRYVDGAEWRAQGHISALLADLSPNQLAALRLAITTGNCLLVVDGIDDILPKKLLTHDFVDRWLGESSTTRLLQTSCWPESPSLLLSLQRDKAQPTRSPPDVLAERMENTLRRVMADQPIPPVHTHDPADLLDDLALALWSATPIATPGAPSRITETALRRHRAPKRSHGSERDPALQHLERMHQSVIAIDSNNQTPQNTNLTQVWQWHAQHAALRAPLPPSVARNTLEKTWITLQWDSLLHHLLSRQIVRALIAGETAPLDILPLHSTTVEYCRNHPDWPQAWPKLARILTRPPAKDISVNALILAVKATPLASTSEQPWRLDGLDLRALDLTSARLDHASFNNTLLTRSQLGGASLRCADLTQTKLDACNLTGANLTEVRASGASFAGAHLEGTQLHSADLQNADLSRTFFLGQPPDYSAAQLSGAMLCAVDWPSNPLSPEQQAEATWRWSTNRITPDRIDECLRTPLLHHVSLAWSPDGHIIAAGDTAGRLTLWSSGPIIHCLALINAHSGPLHSVAFSPDGATIATVGSDQHVRLWRSEDLAVTREYSLQTPVSGLFWRDDRHLWIFGDSTFLWDLSADTPPSRQPWISQAEAGAITHDGRHLVTVRRHENKKRFEVYDTATQSHVALHSSDSGWLSSVDLAKGRLLVDDRGLYIRSLVETSSGRLLVTPNERIDRHMLSHDRPTESWIRDGQRLLILAEHGACFAFDTQSLARQALILPFFLSCILVTADEERLLLASGATFKTTHIGLEPLYAPPDPDLLNINHVEWTRSTLHLRSPNLDLRLDLALGSIERLPSTHYKRPSPDGSRSIDREGDGFSIWDRATQRRTLLDPYPIYNEILQDLDFLWSLDAQKVAVQRSTPSSNSTDTTIWNATTGKQIFQGELPGGGSILLVTKAGISLLVERDRGAWFHLLDLDRDTLLTVKTSPNGSICRVHASQGLRYLAFTTAQSTRVIQSDQLCRALADIPDRSSSVIDLPETATTIAAHPPSHSACAIDEDRGCVAIVAGDTLDVHQIHDGQLLAKIRLDSRPTSLAFSADGEHIMVHYHDHLQFWRLGTPALLARVYLEMSGALVLSNGRFQRLSAANAAQPSLCGFYARSGVQLHPLDRLAHLESKTLCADLWKTLTSTAGARQDAPKE